MTPFNRVVAAWVKEAPVKPVTDDTYQVTEFAHPDEPIDTARYGVMAYKRYLELESIRWMEQNLRDSWVQENQEGLVALFSWRKYAARVVGDDPKV